MTRTCGSDCGSNGCAMKSAASAAGSSLSRTSSSWSRVELVESPEDGRHAVRFETTAEHGLGVEEKTRRAPQARLVQPAVEPHDPPELQAVVPDLGAHADRAVDELRRDRLRNPHIGAHSLSPQRVRPTC